MPRFISLVLIAMLMGAALGLAGCGSSGGTRGSADQQTEVALDQTDARDPAEPVPAHAADSYNRALDAMRVFDWTEAELELKQLILSYPDYAGPYVNLGIVYMAAGRDEEARDALQQALAVNGHHAQAHNQIGILARRQGRFDDAQRAYEEAISVDPGYALAHYNLGVLLDVYLKRPADALTHYQHYQSLIPEADKTVAKWIIDLRRRLGTNETAARVTPEEPS